MTEEISKHDPVARALQLALAAPFESKDVKFKPQIVKGNRCLAMAYIDARLVQDRLDDVVGVENWQDSYKILPDGSVMCRLRVRIGDRWIKKTDVGSPSEQPDGGDRLKAAVSDALKRAAVKFGIGRYLYRLSAQWVDYDPVKKQIVQIPQLPAFALPKAKMQKKPTQTPVATVATVPITPEKQKENEEALREKNIQDAKQWDVLISDPSLDELNGYLPKLKIMHEEIKGACWEKAQQVALRKGWKFNSTTLKFERK